MLEILAPAGSREAVTAAVAGGAGAVYLGYGDYNARRNAKNFTREQLEETVAYCHVRGVKVYLTLNTLLSDGELPGAAREVAFASQVGVDAVLVQDMGVLDMVRRTAPDLPIHASTQMSVMDLDGVKRAADLGCSRVVLARELPMSQIAHICAHSPVEIETFVHGAECMCYSGQCFFSSVIGTRSGNRGLCAQPCRLNYGWRDKAEHALLSLKDMSLAGHLRELDEIGVTCVKIEGRMKRPEYVSVVVGIYAAAVREGREPTRQELEQLRQAFSRQGFTDGYFTDRTGGHMFGTRQEEAEPKELFAAARAFYGKEQPRVALQGSLVMQPDRPLELTLSDGVRTVKVEGEVPQQAQNRPTTGEDAAQRLKKTGGTPYYMERMEVDAGEGLMVPAAALNALRRNALEELTALRGAKPERRHASWTPVEDDSGRWQEKPVFTVAIHSPNQLTTALLERRPGVVYIPLDIASQAKGRFGEMKEMGIQPCVILPRVLWDREVPKVERELTRLKESGLEWVQVTNLGGIDLARRMGLRMRGDFGLEVYNSQCARMYRDMGLESVTLSFEQKLSRVREQQKPVASELVVYGRLPLMITENCIYQARDGKCSHGCDARQTIIDRRRARFPVLRAYGCRNEIFNSLPLWLGDKTSELERCGVWGLRLSFVTETPGECVDILDAYLGNCDYQPKEYTRGLYFRDVE